MKENQEKELIIALPKGRIFTEATECLVKAGVLSKPVSDKSRKLILRDPKTGVRVLILRNHDVPIYVERGAADLGIIGRDVLLEQGRDVYEPLDMNMAPCRLMVAAPEGIAWEDLTGRYRCAWRRSFPPSRPGFSSRWGFRQRSSVSTETWKSRPPPAWRTWLWIWSTRAERCGPMAGPDSRDIQRDGQANRQPGEPEDEL